MADYSLGMSDGLGQDYRMIDYLAHLEPATTGFALILAEGDLQLATLNSVDPAQPACCRGAGSPRPTPG